MALSMFPGAPRFGDFLIRAAAPSEGCAVFLAVSCRHASRWSEGPRRRALEFHAPLCDSYENFDIVRFFYLEIGLYSSAGSGEFRSPVRNRSANLRHPR